MIQDGGMAQGSGMVRWRSRAERRRASATADGATVDGRVEERPRRHRAVRCGASALLLVVAVTGLAGCNVLTRVFMSPDSPPGGQEGLSLTDLAPDAAATVAQGLEIPWEIAFLPGGGFLVTERAGRLLRFPAWSEGDSPLEPEDAEGWAVPGVRHVGEGGLMGIALHPAFDETGWVYLMATVEGADGLENRVDRYRLDEDGLGERTAIVEGIPGNSFHNGGRIAFGPDGHLYVTTGDAGEESLAQDRESLAGKILRVTDEGAVPADNPFDSPVWSYGHRNAQGIAWDGAGRLWSTEHGRSGIQSGLDEVNLISPGANYGWPVIEGDEEAEGMRGPVLHSGPEYTWAPTGAAWADGALYFGGLRGEALYHAQVAGDGIDGLWAHLFNDFGRIRPVATGPDGALHLATSNRDGRGSAAQEDDRIVRIDPAALSQ